MTFEGKILLLLFERNIGLLLFVCLIFLFIYVLHSRWASMGVGTNFGVRGRRREARRAESGGWVSWGGDSQPLHTN